MTKYYTDNGVFEDLPANLSGCNMSFGTTVDFNNDLNNAAVTSTGCEIQAMRGLASGYDITGFVAQPDGTVLSIANVGSTKFKLKDDDNGSTAANRMLLDGDINMDPGLIVRLVYNTTLSRWMRMI